MEYEFYEDVVDAYEAGIGVEPGDSLTDYIEKNNIKIKEIEPFRTDAKDGGLMVAIQRFNEGGLAKVPYDARATTEDMARALKNASAGTDTQKLKDLKNYNINTKAPVQKGLMEEMLKEGYGEPLPRPFNQPFNSLEEYMSGFKEFERNNPYSGAGTAAIIPATLPGGFRYDFSGSQQANKFNDYLESIGQAPYERYTDESMIKSFANGGGIGTMMQPKKKFTMQGDKKPARNYLGEQKTVSNVPLKWQSGPDAPPTELAYITQKEKNLLLKKDLHGSLKNGPNTGPDGIMSLDSQGDYTRDRSSNNQANANSGSNRGDRERAVRAEARMKDILTGQTNIGQTTKTGPKTRKYAVPEYVNVKQPDGTFKNKYVGSGYKSYGQPSFFGNLFSRGAPGYRGIKGMPAFFGKPGFEARQGPNGFGYYSDKENFGETRDALPSFGLLGIAKNIINSFKKDPYEDMSEFNKLQNIDGQVIDPTGLELDKGMFGTSINNTIADSIKNRSMVIDSPFDKKPPATIKGPNIPDNFGSATVPFNANTFDDTVGNRATSSFKADTFDDTVGTRDPIRFNANTFDDTVGTRDPGMSIQNYMERDAGMYSGLPNQKAVNEAAMDVFRDSLGIFNSNTFDNTVGTRAEGSFDSDLFDDTVGTRASIIPDGPTGINPDPTNDKFAFAPGSIKDRQLKQAYNAYNETGFGKSNLEKLMQEDIDSGGQLSLPETAYSMIG